MYEWQRNQLRAAGFVHDWIFIGLCIKEKMRKQGIKSIPLKGYYSPSTAKARQITYGDSETVRQQ